jgi:glycosyltransferase involved in cell wall biosynthesis
MKKNNPALVSIVVPTYNQAQYVEACLDSIMNQTYRNIEIILVNDASPDDTDTIVQTYIQNLESEYDYVADFRNGKPVKKKDPRYPHPRPKILYIKNRRNKGATITYNIGFSKAKGKYSTFVPSDDIILPHHVATLTDMLEKGYDFAYSDFCVIEDNFRINFCYQLPDYDFNECLARWYRLGPSHLFKMRLFKEQGGFDPRYKLANDYDLFLRFAMQGARFVHAPTTLYYKRSHQNRRQGQWRLSNYQKLIDESTKCALRGRNWINFQATR